MAERHDLFGPLPAPRKGARRARSEVEREPLRSAFLVTNHPNLMYMLAAGLLLPPAGFGARYYRDTLASFPGWIPLFAGRIPAAALRQSTGEASHLKACLLYTSPSPRDGLLSRMPSSA